MNPQAVRVAVAGARGSMGSLAVRAIQHTAGMECVGALVRDEPAGWEYDSVSELVAHRRPDVIVDFTVFPASRHIALDSLKLGVRPLIGTSGYDEAARTALDAACRQAGIGAALVPNFAIGAVLMMRFAREAARHFMSAEIVELHGVHKADAPSATAMATAREMADAGTFKRAETALERCAGARGASLDGIGIHSLRLPSAVAQQSVHLAGDDETLTIAHDARSRAAFMPGMLKAIAATARLDRFVYGLEALL